MFLVKLALRAWRQSPFQQALTVGSFAILLLFAAGMHWLDVAMSPIVQRLDEDQVWTAYIKPQIPRRDEEKILDSIRVALGSASSRARIEAVGSEQFLEQIRESHPELITEISHLSGELDEVVPRTVVIAGVLPQEARAEIAALPQIDSVDSSRDRFASTVDAFRTLALFSKMLGWVLIGIACVTVLHAARLQRLGLEDSLRLLKQWGANSTQVQLPALLSGLGMGGLAGTIAAVVWAIGSTELVTQVRALSPVFVKYGEHFEASAALGVWIFVWGLGLGLLGALISGFSSGLSSAGVAVRSDA